MRQLRQRGVGAVLALSAILFALPITGAIECYDSTTSDQADWPADRNATTCLEGSTCVKYVQPQNEDVEAKRAGKCHSTTSMPSICSTTNETGLTTVALYGVSGVWAYVAALISVTLDGVSGVWAYECCLEDLCNGNTTDGNATDGNATDEGEDCLAEQPFVDQLSVFENNNVQGASNEIKIQFSFHARVAAKKKIVIEGFTGLDGPEDSSKLEITLPGTNKMLEPTAAWNLTDGKLTVTSRRVIMPNETVGITFTVINPSETQSKVNVTVTPPAMASGCEVRSRTIKNKILGVTFLNATCDDDEFFGNDCDTQCYGIVVGDKCACTSDLQFGSDCNGTAVVNTLKSLAATAVAKGVALTLTSPDGTVLIEFPAGALLEDMILEIMTFAFSNFKMPKTQTSYAAAGPIVVFLPHGIIFAVPVTIWLDVTILARRDGKKLRPAVFNKETQIWELLEGEIVNGRMKAKTTHFSQFSTLSVPDSATAPTTSGGGGGGYVRDCTGITPPTITYTPGTDFCAASFGDASYGEFSCGVKFVFADTTKGAFELDQDAVFPTGSTCLKISILDKSAVSLTKADPTSYPHNLKSAHGSAPEYPADYPLRNQQVPASAFSSMAMDITLPRGMSLTVTSPEITNDDANRRDILPEMTVFGVKIAVTAGGANHRTDAAFRANRRAVTTCPSGKGYRLGKVGSTYQDACLCAKSCGPSATCKISEGGQWVAMLVPDSACEEVVMIEKPGWCSSWSCQLAWIIGGAVLLCCIAAGFFLSFRMKKKIEILAPTTTTLPPVSYEPMGSLMWWMPYGVNDQAPQVAGSSFAPVYVEEGNIMSYSMPSGASVRI